MAKGKSFQEAYLVFRPEITIKLPVYRMGMAEYPSLSALKKARLRIS